MTSDKALQLIVKLAGSKLLVRANRFGCDSDLAREAHDNVIEILDGLREELGRLIDLACAAARAGDPQEQDDLLYHLRQLQMGMERDWYEPQPYGLGGWRRIDGESFFNPVTGRTQPIGDELVIQPIPEARLCGLPAILDELADECAVTFDCEIVFWKAKPPRTPEAGTAEPFDPDIIPF